MICSICGNVILSNSIGWESGNNAEPINNGRCCDKCNFEVVLPVRIKALKRGKK